MLNPDRDPRVGFRLAAPRQPFNRKQVVSRSERGAIQRQMQVPVGVFHDVVEYGDTILISASCAAPPPIVIAGVLELPVRLGNSRIVRVLAAGSSGWSTTSALSVEMLWLLPALPLATMASITANSKAKAMSPSMICGFSHGFFGTSRHGSGLPLASRSLKPALTRSGSPMSSSSSGCSRQKRSKSVVPLIGSLPER